MSTSADLSTRFISGLRILHSHATANFTINIVETSDVHVYGMTPLSDDEVEKLKDLHWHSGNSDKGVGWAQFSELEYEDY